jgi:hypothetical protein
MEEILAKMRGENLEDYRERKARDAEAWKEAETIIDQPPEKWPELPFCWDLSQEGMRFALDGESQESFNAGYPQGLIWGACELLEFDRKICRFARREGSEELWSVGIRSKLASVICYIAKGNPITPPLIVPLDSGELTFAGGHHRYAAAKASGLKEIVFYTQPASRAAVSQIIPVRWGRA